MSGRLDRVEWVRTGLAVLSEAGIEAVRVEPLARRLGVTKGSFYWHFVNRDALLSAMLEEWERVQTSEVIAGAEAVGGDAARRLKTLSDLALGLDMRLEAAARVWASTDERAYRAVQQVDGRRLGFLQSVIEGAGVPEATAQARARLVYYALIGEIVCRPPDWLDRHRRAMRLNREMILRWP